MNTGAWAAVSSAALALSWFGVHAAIGGTAYDRPRAVPLAEGDGAEGPRGSDAGLGRLAKPPAGQPAQRPQASASGGVPAGSTPGPFAGPREFGASATVAPVPTGSSPEGAAPNGSYGDVKSYAVEGGRVVLDVTADSAELVQAVPESGWRVQVHKNSTWIRVDFTGSDGSWTVFCDWSDGTPGVRTWQNGS